MPPRASLVFSRFRHHCGDWPVDRAWVSLRLGVYRFLTKTLASTGLTKKVMNADLFVEGQFTITLIFVGSVKLPLPLRESDGKNGRSAARDSDNIS